MISIFGLDYPVVGVAPIDGISDSPFRYITKKYGNPDIMFTEFTHVHGLCVAAQNILDVFEYDESQRPIFAQIYGTEPEYFYHAAKIVCALGFDGIDINMGCPAKTVSASGAGAGLIRTPDLAREIIAATKQGAKDWTENGELTGLSSKSHEAVVETIKRRISEFQISNFKLNTLTPGQHNLLSQDQSPAVPDGKQASRVQLATSVKTRVGYDTPITESWITNLTLAKPEWITVHGRTLKQLYAPSANWNEIKIAVNSTDIPVLANGDINTHADIERVLEQTGAVGALIGRGTFGNPWIFKSDEPVSREQRIATMMEHTKKFLEIYPEPKAFFRMRKHFGWYMTNFDNSKEIRMQLMRASSLEDVEDIVNKY